MIDIKGLKGGEVVKGVLAVRSIDGPGEGLREYSNKKGRFFVIRVGNTTGDITLKYWGGSSTEKAALLFRSLEVGDVVSVEGRCVHDSFDKGLVISVNEETKYGSPKEDLKKVTLTSFSPEEFIPSLSPGEREALSKKLSLLIGSIKNEELSRLVRYFFDDERMSRDFALFPSARRHHHNYLGGLMEHSLNVAALCETLCGFYDLDRDLLVACALLHDLGKLREYDIKASIDMTVEGRLIGHLPMGAEMVSKAADELDGFPRDLKNQVVHIILAHHGEYEKGSPRLPAFPEAMALHLADYTDAFVRNSIQETDDLGPGEWKYSRSLGRFIYSREKE